jgi:hypothetical protein
VVVVLTLAVVCGFGELARVCAVDVLVVASLGLSAGAVDL